MINILFISLIPTILLLFFKRFVVITNFTLVSLVVFFILLYSILILITNSLDKNDFMILKTFKNKLLNIKKNTTILKK